MIPQAIAISIILKWFVSLTRIYATLLSKSWKKERKKKNAKKPET